ERRRFEPLTGRMVAERTVVRDGHVRRIPYFVRAFTFTELRDWLLHAGFTSVQGYDEDGDPLTLDSRRMIAVARPRSHAGRRTARRRPALRRARRQLTVAVRTCGPDRRRRRSAHRNPARPSQAPTAAPSSDRRYGAIA